MLTHRCKRNPFESLLLSFLTVNLGMEALGRCFHRLCVSEGVSQWHHTIYTVTSYVGLQFCHVRTNACYFPFIFITISMIMIMVIIIVMKLMI